MTVSMTSKPAGRAALETPFSVDHETSLHRRMDEGIQPKGLEPLIRWFRDLCDSETPVTLHEHSVWRDYGEHAKGGSQLGTLAYSDPFRRLIEGSDQETDPDGYYVRPLRAALARMGKRWPLTARHLFRLALVDGDWRRHAENVAWQYEEMSIYIEEALRKLWIAYADQSLRLQ